MQAGASTMKFFPHSTEKLASRDGVLRQKYAKAGGEEWTLRQQRSGSSIQRRVPSIVNQVLNSPGRALEDSIRKSMEARFHHDFSGVRVHTDSTAALSAKSVNAGAFTVGNHMVFGADQYAPNSENGRRLLAHELTHAIQQEGINLRTRALLIGPADGPFEAQAQMAETVPLRVRPAGECLAAGIAQRDVLPVESFSPARGLTIDRTEKSVSITGAMELSGSEASAVNAALIQSSINNTWTKNFPDGYSMSCNITVAYRPPGSEAGNATQIVAEKITRPSYVSTGLRGRSMNLNTTESDIFTWVATHEFGHIIGLKDRYSESIMSNLRKLSGGKRTVTAQPGYRGNIMATKGGVLESKNIKDIAEESKPSEFWVYNDDRVRAWVTRHSLNEISKISTASKVTAIKTLTGGIRFFSNEDQAAVRSICNSVTSKAEADAIRAGVDVSGLDPARRLGLKWAFAKMP